ncbi:MAG: alpha-L-fucosidase [Verrucomicrobia bacterium]|nr:alpha-L-fucosidase [Verrucomicrobiota bacterium]
MKNIILTGLLAGTILTDATAQWSHKEGDPMPHPAGIVVQPFTHAEWDASNFAPAKDLQWYRDARYGMFIHFGLSTHNNADLSWGVCQTRKAPDAGSGPVPDAVWQGWPKDFQFEKFDAREWVEIARAGGFKYIVAIAKHHDGFHLWDTAFSDFKVTNTPFKRDYLRELADACHAAAMPFGIYYSQRDWYHPDYMPVDPAKANISGNHWTLKPGETSPMGERHKKYNEYQFNVVRELCTKYGKVDIFWWDAAWWGGMFTAEIWDGEKLTRMVRELQPGILMNNRCSVPGDFDTPEQRLGFYQDWRPWESCVCLTHSWSYSGSPPKSRDEIIRMLISNACCDGNLLLSWGPQWDGEFAATEKSRLLEVGAWLKDNGRAIYGTRGGPWKWAEWGGSTRRDKTVWLHVFKGDTLSLPALPERTVLSAQLLTGEKVDFKQEGAMLTVTVPKGNPFAIVELTFDKSVDTLPAVSPGDDLSIFNDAVTYGKVVSRQATVKASSIFMGTLQALVAETPRSGSGCAHRSPKCPGPDQSRTRDSLPRRYEVQNRRDRIARRLCASRCHRMARPGRRSGRPNGANRSGRFPSPNIKRAPTCQAAQHAISGSNSTPQRLNTFIFAKWKSGERSREQNYGVPWTITESQAEVLRKPGTIIRQAVG